LEQQKDFAQIAEHHRILPLLHHRFWKLAALPPWRSHPGIATITIQSRKLSAWNQGKNAHAAAITHTRGTVETLHGLRP
jgi:hypothetical protein